MLSQLLERATGEHDPAEALHKFANTVSSVEQKKAVWRLRCFRQRPKRQPPANQQEEKSLSSFCSSTRSLELLTYQRSLAQRPETHSNVVNFYADSGRDVMMPNAVPSSSSTATPVRAGASGERSSRSTVLPSRSLRSIGSHKSLGPSDEELQKSSLRRFHREGRRQEPLLQELKSLQEQVKKQMPMCQNRKQLLSCLGDRFRKSLSAASKESQSIQLMQAQYTTPPASPPVSAVLSPTAGQPDGMCNQQASPPGSSALEAWDSDRYLRDLEELELLEEQDEALEQARLARAKAQRPAATFLAAVRTEGFDAEQRFSLLKPGSRAKARHGASSIAGRYPIEGSSSSSSMHSPPPVPPPPRTGQGGRKRSMGKDSVPRALPPVPRDPPAKTASHPEASGCSSSQPRLRGEIRRVFSGAILAGRVCPSKPARPAGEAGAKPDLEARSLAASCLRPRERSTVELSLAELSILPMAVGAATPAPPPAKKGHGSRASSAASGRGPRQRPSRRGSRLSVSSSADTDIDQTFKDQLHRGFSVSAVKNYQVVQQRSELFQPSSQHS